MALERTAPSRHKRQQNIVHGKGKSCAMPRLLVIEASISITQEFAFGMPYVAVNRQDLPYTADVVGASQSFLPCMRRTQQLKILYFVPKNDFT